MKKTEEAKKERLEEVAEVELTDQEIDKVSGGVAQIGNKNQGKNSEEIQ